MADSAPSFPDHDLAARHAAVHDLLRAHGEAIHADLSRPRVAYLRALEWEQLLAAHLRFEEEQVLPAYARAVAEPPSPGSADNFLGDHRLIERRCQQLRARLLECELRGVDSGLARLDVAELDELLDHHDQREQEYLYPRLQEELDGEERGALARALAERPARPVPSAADLMPISEHPLVSALVQTYRRWRDLVDGRGKAEAAAAIEEAAPPDLRAKFRALARRDQRLIAQFAARAPEDLPARARAERSVDQTLRSTLQLALRLLWEQARKEPPP